MLVYLNQLIRQQRGQALVEVALVLPIFLLLIFGIIEFGRVLGAYLLITHASREGARAGAVGAADTDIANAVNNAVPTLDPGRVIIHISPDSTSRVRGAALTVRVDYSVPLYAPFITSILTNPFPLSAQTTMRIE
ncbi:MAG: pilus assembly protein [Firmicutes bacterium]|nr:pilus assembly protein [Bacillota bacterium]